MRIAQVSTMASPVRRETGGSVESFIWLLTRELVRLGHDVTVFGTGGSEVPGRMVETLPGPYGDPGCFDDWQLCEWVNIARAVEQSSEFDLMHTHAYLWAMPLQPVAHAPMVHTLHIVPDDNAVQLWRRYPGAHVTALSQQQWSGAPDLNPLAVIPHGVDLSQFTLREKPDDYVCYLGRFVSGKGPLQAIATAKAAGLRLVLAGPENRYFRERVRPLVDGDRVEYVGFVSGDARDRLLGGARALLYPIQYPESFGLVLVESMLCGTPVAAMRFGAVPEIVEEGVNGYMADSTADLANALLRAVELDRCRVRAWAAERFSADAMAQAYLRAYEQVLKGPR
jgi:glycosyltransferase involved in cell wall biosynthesis